MILCCKTVSFSKTLSFKRMDQVASWGNLIGHDLLLINLAGKSTVSVI